MWNSQQRCPPVYGCETSPDIAPGSGGRLSLGNITAEPRSAAVAEGDGVALTTVLVGPQPADSAATSISATAASKIRLKRVVTDIPILSKLLFYVIPLRVSCVLR